MGDQDQLRQARQVIRDFVLEMREGKRMMVLAPSGQLKSTTCSLSRGLDTFRIVRAGKVRRIPLTDIQQIHSGLEPEGLRTPLDDLCATVSVAPDGALITFRLEHINARDTFVMCMMLFAQSVGAQPPENGEEWEYEEDDEYEEGEHAHEGAADGREDDQESFQLYVDRL
mmetsp:Transcript_113562/g.315943  ORF Transcript_113562/g.315943 Transcript_113562/m.315943 type:complete len:170 (-) Transcript_113562:103-612(-)